MIRIEALSGAPAISAAAVAVVPRLGLAIPACAGVADPATIPLRAAPTKSAPMVEALLDFVDIIILLRGTRRIIALVVWNLSMQRARQCALRHQKYERLWLVEPTRPPIGLDGIKVWRFCLSLIFS
jgi:hypothetical protein